MHWVFFFLKQQENVLHVQFCLQMNRRKILKAEKKKSDFKTLKILKCLGFQTRCKTIILKIPKTKEKRSWQRGT